MTSNRTGCAWLVVLASLLGGSVARADSWPPPVVKTVQSEQWSARATITPDRTYAPRVVEHGDTAQVRVERHAGHGKWRVVWEGPLLNSTAPVDALVSDDGATLVTFDNHHSMGYGDDVVVIYDATGRVVRKLSLEQLLPAAWIEATVHSVSSIWWRGRNSAIVDDGRTLLIDVIAPGQDHAVDPQVTVPLLVRLVDGALLHAQRPEWKAALRELVPIVARKDEAWARHREMQAAPLLAPAATDHKSWRKFAGLARERIAHRTGEKIWTQHLDSELAPGGDGWENMHGKLDGHTRYPDAKHYLLVSPYGTRLAGLLAKHLAGMAPASLAGTTLWITAPAADIESVRRAATATGAKVERLDVEAGMPGVDLPKARPAGFTGDRVY